MDLLGKKIKKAEKKLKRALIIHGTIFYLLLIGLVMAVFSAWFVYAKDKQTTIQFVEKNNYLSKGKVFSLVFDNKMLRETVESGLTIEPKIEIEKRWLSKNELEVEIMERTLPDTTYQVKIKGIKTAWFIPVEDKQFSFNSPQTPMLKNVEPKDGANEIEYNTKIIFDFDKPVHPDFFLEVMIDPLTGFDYSFNSERDRLEVSPQEPMPKATKYELSLKMTHKEHSDFAKELYRGSFVTKVPPQIVYAYHKDGTPTKIEERAEHIDPVIKKGRYVHIDLSSQSLTIFQDGVDKGTYKVSTGKRGMDTPIGTHKVLIKAKRPWSNKYKLFMPWFIGFTNQSHGIHELPEWPGGIKEGANHLGIPVSHGCVRLGVGPAKKVYDFVEIGTPVVISQ
ncbi:MAG TPA: L,D-transpeptidase [Candidatus Moranbacteria bacterium]|nr:L,D-transpeptidase [Candidatus Moranbacteria bacterium]